MSVALSGPVGCHGITVLAARGSLEFEAELESDTADLCPLALSLWEGVGGAAHVLRDPTRGGVASALNEIAALSGVGIELDEEALVIPAPVQAACEMLGLDPLYVANEGIMVAIVGGSTLRWPSPPFAATHWAGKLRWLDASSGSTRGWLS